MSPQKKSILAFASFFIILAVIACSCPSILPTTSSGSEPISGLAGRWNDPDIDVAFTIAWQNNAYKVTSAVDSDGYDVTISSQYWDGSSLTWVITNADGDYSITYTTVSVANDTLTTDWYDSDGSSGTGDLDRIS